ncbi:MAG: PEP/pyruvate-binding domain-containing protein, partial [Endomicrobiaceae bacterium]|nr:PEP/pyruvate-binding domain-containing protein [Endomicrobiaceae bacterium]
ALELEKSVGYPIDIEFAIDQNNQIYILQRRPITTLAINETFAGTIENKQDIDQAIIDKLISDLNGISRDNNLAIILEVKETLKNLPADIIERYEIITEQINRLFDIIKSDSRTYKSYLVKYILPFIPFINLRGTGKSLINALLDLFPVDNKSDYYDAIKLSGDMIKQTYPLSIEKTIEIIKFLNQKDVISYREMPYSIKDALSEYKYDGLKSYYITVAESGIDKELADILIDGNNKLKKLNILDSEINDKLKLYTKEFDFLSDKINISTVPLLEYQLNSLINDVVNNTSLEPENKSIIIHSILSISKQIIIKTNKIDKNILNKFSNIALESYNINHNIKNFEQIITFFLFVVQNTNNFDKSETNNLAGEYLAKIALDIYAPVKSETGDEKEYHAREELCLSIFKQLSDYSPNNLSVYKLLFNTDNIPVSEYRFLLNTNEYNKAEGINLSEKTLAIFLNAVNNSKFTNVSCPIPYQDSDIIYSDKLIDMFVNSSKKLDIVSICRKLYSSGKNGKQIVFEIIKKLHEISGENWNIQTRIDAALSLASLASSSLYSIINDEQIFNIDKINKVFEELDAASFLKPTEAYISNIYGNSRYSENSAKDIYEFTSLIQHLPPEILSDADIVQKSPIYFRTDGTTNTKQKEVKKLVERFDTLQEILNYNALVLAMLDNSSGSMSEKDFNNIIDCLRKMIDGFIKINEKHGNESKQSLQKILNSMGKISSDSIKKQMTISKWDFDSIPDIEEIHTLINAVHQTSIYDFKKSIGDVSDVGNTHIKTITATQEDTSILAYDLSDKRINRDIINLIGNLVTKKIPKPVEGSGRYKIEDFICKDDMLVWTTRLFVHSVDVFMNFGNTDRGITIYYHEGGRNIGNAERVRYFTTILEKLGFNVEADMKVDQHDNSGVCGLKAVLNKDFGLDDTTNMVDIASRVILLFKYSNMLDWDLGGLYDMYSYTSYLQTFNNLVEKFIDGEIWVGYSPTSTDSFGDKGHNLTQRLEKPRANMTKFYNSILSYLGLDTLPETIKGWNLEQPKIDKYFNKYIERSYIEGAIIFDEKGILKKNEKYDIMSSIIYEITSNVSETSKQSRIVNLINRYEFSFRTLGYVGSLIAVTGIMKLTNGDKLFVKGVMNPYTRRMKYAIVELVTTNGRKKLDSDELISLLSQEGYDISNQEWVGTRERKLIRNLLERNIQVIDSPEVRCTSTSDGNGIYVSGNITFDKNNVNNDSILVVPYTTPDDIEAIKTSRGIITTGGGILSHAAITTREYKKPSVVINGATWLDKEAEIQYYLSVGDVETIKNFQLQKVKVKNLVLKEGYRVLMNGETGTVLLFNDIDIKLLNELQSCIEENNQKSIINFMKKYEDNKDIRRLVEYVYFQSIGNSNLQQILFAVFSNEMPATVKTKIKELNESYIQDKIRNITEGIENIRSIDNVNISYGIIEMLSKKLNLIKTSDERADLKNLKEEITSLQKEIKDRLFIYIKLLISDSQMYIEKKHLDIKDVRNIINMLNTANVYDFFVPSSEERTDLKDMSNILIQLMGQLEIKIKDYLLKDEIVGTNREITTFDNIYEEDGNKFGSKTTELAKMYRLLKNQKGVHIPNGMGVSVDVLELLFNVVGNKDGFMLKDFDNAIKNKDYSAAVQIAEKISSAIDDKNISAVRKEFENFLKNKIAEFARQGVKYSVRSSGVGEDGSSRAFAGMGETKLNVSFDNVYDSIKECWKSFFSERCISYMIESGQVVKPAVLVQEMVNVDKAGVVFSRNKYGNETIEVLYGLGEGLVSGTLTPDTIEVDIKNGEIIEYSVADKQFKIVATDDGTARETVEQGVKARTLDAKTVKQLTEIIRILEKDAGYPVDVEFGIKDGEIYILQRRAITTLDAASQENSNIIDNKNLNDNDKNELKQFITVITGDISKESDIFVNIQNPENSDEAISIYLKSTENNRSIFYVDSKYSHLIKDGRIISLLVERINTDSVIREKFNSNLSIFDRVDNGEIGILPIIDILDDSILEKSIDINIENIKSILSAA